MGLKEKFTVWLLEKKLKGSPMFKWLRKYPVLLGVFIVCLGTVLEFFGAGGWADVLQRVAHGLGVGLGDVASPVSAAEVSGAVAGLLGVAMKLVSDAKKRKAAKHGNQGNG